MKYKINAYVLVEADEEEEEIFNTREEAEKEIEFLSDLESDVIYQVEEVEDENENKNNKENKTHEDHEEDEDDEE